MGGGAAGGCETGRATCGAAGRKDFGRSVEGFPPVAAGGVANPGWGHGVETVHRRCPALKHSIPVIHLDTNFLIDALLPGSAQEARLVGWLNAGETLGISTVAWGEFLCGPISNAAESLARQLLPDAEVLKRPDAETAADLFNRTGRRAKSFADCCIAATAIRVSAPLATSNQADFLPLAAYGLVLA